MTDGKICGMIEKVMGCKIGDALRDAVERYAAERYFPKWTLLVRQGDVLSTLYLIVRGLVRGYYLDEDGREVTKCFSCENGFAGAQGVLGQNRADFSVECLEDTDCIAVPYAALHTNPEAQQQFDEVLGRFLKPYCCELEKQARDRTMLDAEGRYREFLKRYGPIERRLRKAHIASFIGVQPSTLSRIRQKIKIRGTKLI